MCSKRQLMLFVIALIMVCTLSLITMQTGFAVSEDISISARGAIMLECSTNTVLYAKNAHEKLPMASTTKVMTALVAIENGDLDELVTTADEAYGVEGSSIYLSKNEQLSLRDLLYGLMLRSGNDAAVAIAIHVGGSVDRFTALMNKKAAELGAYNTNFVNPNGLPDDNHYTTAYDLGLICSAALKNDTFRQIVSTQYHTAETGTVKRTMMNKNKLLWQYEGAIGIKTGYTQKAGKCLTFASERNGMTVVGVVLNCPDMFPDSIKLMDHCFNTYEMYTVISANTPVVRSQVDNTLQLATFVTANDVCIPVKKSEGIKLKTQISLKEKLSSPLSRGENTGKLLLYNEHSLVATVDLICADNIRPVSFLYYLNRAAMQFAS